MEDITEVAGVITLSPVEQRHAEHAQQRCRRQLALVAKLLAQQRDQREDAALAVVVLRASPGRRT